MHMIKCFRYPHSDLKQTIKIRTLLPNHSLNPFWKGFTAKLRSGTESPQETAAVPRRGTTFALSILAFLGLSPQILPGLPNSDRAALSNRFILNFLNLQEGLCVWKRTIALQKPFCEFFNTPFECSGFFQSGALADNF